MIDQLRLYPDSIDEDKLVYLVTDDNKELIAIETIVNQYKHCIPTREGHDNVTMYPPLDNKYYRIYDTYNCTILGGSFLGGKINYHLFHKLCPSIIGICVEREKDVENGWSAIWFDKSILPFPESDFELIDDFIINLSPNKYKQYVEKRWGEIIPYTPYYFNKSKFEYDKRIEMERSREMRYSKSFGTRLPGM